MSKMVGMGNELKAELQALGFHVSEDDEQLIHPEEFDQYTDTYGRPLTAFNGEVDYTIIARPSWRMAMILSGREHDWRVELTGVSRVDARNVYEAVEELYELEYQSATEG